MAPGTNWDEVPPWNNENNVELLGFQVCVAHPVGSAQAGDLKSLPVRATN